MILNRHAGCPGLLCLALVFVPCNRCLMFLMRGANSTDSTLILARDHFSSRASQIHLHITTSCQSILKRGLSKTTELLLCFDCPYFKTCVNGVNWSFSASNTTKDAFQLFHHKSTWITLDFKQLLHQHSNWKFTTRHISFVIIIHYWHNFTTHISTFWSYL